MSTPATSSPSRPPGTIGPLTQAQLAETLKLLREAKKITQESMAAQVQVSTRTIVRLEKGDTVGKEYYLRQVYRVLGYELQQTLYYELKPLAGAEQAGATEPGEKS